MLWNFDNYYTDSKTGLISKLKLSHEQLCELRSIRQQVRERTRDVFEEARQLALEIRRENLTYEQINLKLQSTNIRYLSEEERRTVAELLKNMDEAARDDFINLQPRFGTQGSFQYDTLNQPYRQAQEMDIDDGTYLPMTVFGNEPRIGHTILVLLVDTSLKSLVSQNSGWEFQQKQTCGRIKIKGKKTHIDVPMYAIPKDKFALKQTAMDSRHGLKTESILKAANESAKPSFKLDPKNVNLALREGAVRWRISDPKIVEDWFEDSCKRIGPELRLVCRFLKAWRDAQFEIGGPSSISLMAAAVNILDSHAPEGNGLTAIMKVIAEKLPDQFSHELSSPDDSDDEPLFPSTDKQDERQKAIVAAMREFAGLLTAAGNETTAEKAMIRIEQAYGSRGIPSSLIVSKKAAPAYSEEPQKASEPSKINTTMISG